MKNVRKIASLVLALVMVLSLATTAFAAEDEGYTITIKGTTGHSYEVYQIFTGDLSGNVLSNIVWGDGVSEDGQTALGNAAVKAETLTDDNIKAFAADVDQYLTNPRNMNESNGTYTLSGLEAGYYLIKDEDSSLDGKNNAYTAYMLKVVKDVNADPKDSVPTVDKSVTEQGVNADDVGIGDTVTFILKATLGDNLDEYATYKVVFHDTMSDGLIFKEYVSATLDNTDVKTSFERTQNGNALNFTCDDVIALGAESGDTIVITYTATLNSDAEIGTPGNPNKVYLEYSNDPNWDADGDGEPDNPDEPDEPTGETPEDEVLVFTYELDVTKVDGADADKKLKDAEFVLYRGEGVNIEYVLVTEGKVSGWTNDVSQATTLKSDDNGLFKVAGLDAGTYYLRETKAPAGYNLLTKDIKLAISATLTTTEDAAALTALTISVDDKTAANGVLDTGVVSATVENNAGSTLPETGGMGTTLFYVLGGIMVLAAVVLLVTKKRMTSAE